MADSIELLKMKILLCFQRMSQKSCSVTNLAKVLGAEKYSVSRAMTALEKEGLVNRSSPRQPKLTGSGESVSKKYTRRMDVVTNHLIYEGVSYQQAQRDAAFLTLYCSDETLDVIQDMEAKYKIHHVFKNKREFDGSDICRHLRDGDYTFPFIIYRENLKFGSNISSANYGFEHPCIMTVENKKGIVKLKAQTIIRPSAKNGIRMKGKVSFLQYYDGFGFCDAGHNGDVFSFPAEYLKFLSIGNGNSCVFHGSVYLKMMCSAGAEHMPESAAVFTVLI